MCFSAEADLLSGVGLSGVGVDALRHLPHRRYLPLALLPLLFGMHQLIEALAWWGLEGRVSPEVGRAAVWAYLAIAFLVLPPLVPTAMLSAEGDPRRRRRLMPLVVLGLAVAAALVPGLIGDRAGAEVACRYIAYDAGVPYAGFLLPFYVAATCGPMLLSANRSFVVFGVANLAAVGLLSWLLAGGVISLWCAWAAVASVIIARHLRVEAPRERCTAVAARA